MCSGNVNHFIESKFVCELNVLKTTFPVYISDILFNILLVGMLNTPKSCNFYYGGFSLTDSFIHDNNEIYVGTDTNFAAYCKTPNVCSIKSLRFCIWTRFAGFEVYIYCFKNHAAGILITEI